MAIKLKVQLEHETFIKQKYQVTQHNIDQLILN